MSWLDRVLLLDIFAGLKVTATHGTRKADTVEYPEQCKEPSERFRGMFRLDEERCIKCTLCAIECPINIIYIDWHTEKTPEGKAEKKLDRFDQLMGLGWKALLPISLGNLLLVAVAALWGAAGFKVLGAVLVLLVAAGFFAVWRRPARPRSSTTMASSNVEVRA